MSRSALFTGLGLIALGLVVFAWKAVGLGLPVLPSQPAGLWQVEIQLAVRGRGETGSIRLALPMAGPGQRIFGEWASAEDLEFAEREMDDRRVGIWTGWMEDTHLIDYVFRVERYPVELPEIERSLAEPPEALRSRYAQPEVTIPSTSEAIRSLVARLELPGPEDRAGRVRSLYAFVRHEIEQAPAGADDAILTLAQREGNERGRARLLVALLRAVGIPARVVSGLELRDARGWPRTWVDVWWDVDWLPVSPTEGFFGELPLDWVVLGPGDASPVESTGIRAVSLTVHALHETLSLEELGAMMLPSDRVFGELSLYRLPVTTQAALRILLLLPLAALVIALLRNLVGVPSYGTFMPLLLAMAMRGTGLVLGLGMVAAVIAIGVLGRVLVDRLRLLLVPRLSILLCLVILCVSAVALVGQRLDRLDFQSGIVFPIVILTMLIERFSVVMAEEGLAEALGRAAWSTAIAVACYPLFRSPLLEHLMFGFPELVLVVMGLLVLLGAYTGYRASDWLRFRALARERAGGMA